MRSIRSILIGVGGAAAAVSCLFIAGGFLGGAFAGPTASLWHGGARQLAAVEGSGSGLIAWWKLDDGSGSTASDSSGIGNSGAITGATWTTGQSGGALAFAASNDRAMASADLIGAGDVSVCAWYYAASAPFGAILASNGKFALSISVSNRWDLTSDGSHDFLSATNAIVTGAWNHVCATRASSGAGVIYVNGVQSGAGSSGTPVAGSPFTVGNHPWQSHPWNGSIDDVRVYNRLLSAAEVQAIYAEGASGGPATAPAPTPTPTPTPTPVLGSASAGQTTSAAGSQQQTTGSAPSVPAGLVARAVSSSEIDLSWSASSGASGVAGYQIYRNGAQISTANSTSYADTGLPASTNYSYTVAAYDSAGDASAQAPSVSTTTLPAASAAHAITAASCSQTDVQSAIDAASTGDTVTIPAGSCTWTMPVSLNKPITLQGSGNQQTVITDGTSKTASSNWYALILSSSAGGITRLTNITLTGGTYPAGNPSRGMLVIGGSDPHWRVDHVHFLATRSVAITEYAKGGVIDHNLFDLNEWDFAIFVYNGDGTYGDISWTEPLDLGNGSDAVYIEDNVIEAVPGAISVALDAWSGARYVVRYNTLKDVAVMNHGTETAQRYRGARAFEVYNNTFTLTAPESGFTGPMLLRSGNGVIFNNTATGPWPQRNGAYDSFANVDNYRDFGVFTPWGQCDGTSPYDKNDGVVYETGTATAAFTTTSAFLSILTDVAKNWTPNQWVGYTVKDLRSGVSSIIDANTASTISARYDATHSPGLTWQTGDAYQIVRASVCIDQMGRGAGDLLTGNGTASSPAIDSKTGTASWPNQAPEQTYAWNNSTNGIPNNLTSSSAHVIEGRDFFSGVSMPGYVPYTYPNPLIAESTNSAQNTIPVQTNPTSSATPPAISAAAASSIGPAGAVVSWSTDKAADSQVEYGLTSAYGNNTALDSALTISHAATLSGLAANTVYHYRVDSRDASGNIARSSDQTFTTAAAVSQAVSSGGGGSAGGGSTGGGGSSAAAGGGASSAATGAIPPSVSVGGGTAVSGASPASSAGLIPASYLSLAPGTRSSSVVALQNYLINGGYLGAGLNTGYYGPLTTAAVQRYQAAAAAPSSSAASSISSAQLALPYGSRSASVVSLQESLIGLGYLGAGLNTGYYGPLTKAAVQRYLSGLSTSASASASAAIVAAPAAVSSPSAPASSSSFARDLTIGSTGPDVVALQQFLNAHGFLVSSSGSGSPGHETSYYGPATAAAVSRFQNAYAAEILVPYGLSQGTGYFGPSTRKQAVLLSGK
ncbi:MAG: peptidoglycan-binding protein [Patescibacteria group bacterium]|nr:peptidoglycan-binding protein [Patescibacteria group bacterium]